MKRTLSLVLILTLLLSLCACGSKGNDNTEPSSSLTENSSTTEQTDATTAPTGGASMDSNKPTVPENNGNAKPTVPENNSNAKPTVPDNNGNVKPTVPENNGNVKPTVPDNNGNVTPTVPDNNGNVTPTVPEETVPEETVPEETVPEETVPEETVPEETVPEETIPVDLMENVVAVKTSSAGGAITAHPGGRITYTISITNNNDQAIDVTVTDTLPEGTSLVSGCSDAEGSNLSWNIDSIPAGETKDITYTVKPEYTIAQVRESETDIIITNTPAKVMDKDIAAPSKDIYVLETFNKEDRRKMEMAIDALVTANLTAKNSSNQPLNRIPLLTMMYYVGFTVSPGFGTTDPNEVITMVFDQAGQGGSSSGSGGTEDVTDTATNLLDRVAPTLYGGTQVPASKDSLFRGARATSVTADDLISGDVLFVNKGGETKVYIYDGTYLVETAETQVTTNIAPATVLSTLSSADKWVVIRPSINLNITFSYNEGEYFNDYDKQEYTDLEKALIATAEAYLLRGDRTQYSDDGQGANRYEGTIKQPEDYTVDQYGYTNCAYFTYDVHWATYGYAAKAILSSSEKLQVQNNTKYLADAAAYQWDPETKTGGNASTIFYCEPMVKSGSTWVSNMTEQEQAEAKQYIIDNLRPGDIICIRRTTGSGHAMLYAGNGTIIHSSGSSYSSSNKTDTHEASVRFRMVADLFDPTIYNETSYVFNLESFSIVRLQNLKTDAAATENTLNRINNMQGIIGEKVASTAMGKTVNAGDTITYTFHIFNTNDTAKQVEIKDVLSEHVVFLHADNGGIRNGNDISWNLNIPAKTRISMSYTVEVKDGVATYTAIDGSKATINGVIHKCIDSYVANTLTPAQQQALVAAVETVKGMDVSGLTSVQIANLIYKEAFGVDNIFGEGVTTYGQLLDGGANQSTPTKGTDNVGIFNDTWYWESSNKAAVSLMDSNTSNGARMVAPGMYSGALVINSTYNKNGRNETYYRYTTVGNTPLRSRYFWEKDLVVGDIFMMKGSTSEQMFIYIGNDIFVSIGDGFTLFTEKSVAERFQYAPSSTWKKLAVLRPSIVLDI